MDSTTHTLVLVRHGQSEDNERELSSGLRDPVLTALGVKEARAAGRRLKALRYRFDYAFTSRLQRAQHTLALILDELSQANLPVYADAALNERDYGALAGLNKTEARVQFGAEQVRCWRKSYDAVPPTGEILAMTAARLWPFFKCAIAPRVYSGGCALVVAHGNSLRSLLMRLDHIEPANIEDVNIDTEEMLIYRCSADDPALVRESAVTFVT